MRNGDNMETKIQCPECGDKDFETDAMMLVTGQIGGEQKMLIVHTCNGCGHKWRGHV
jgi:DNA-directed RNA polymerase subunit M/transcription elongation factor TFIIS|tara:strand:- start:4195 stop:4365 length:171 start_codon:yes stop_codon:yes gene_type:complete